jgi:ABC-2 type transport system ATP-binding protein
VRVRAPRPEILVRIKSVSVGYDDVPVCGPATLTVRSGEALAVVGRNGTGKSTLLRTLLGLLPAISGSVEVLGSPVDERSVAFRRGVAGVLDDDAFFPALTVAEHLVLTARGHGVDDVDGTVEDLLEEFGLVEHADVLPTALSSGQRRRLLLAAAFARPRRLLVLDEPEQRLDSAMRERLAERLVAERRAGGAVVLASHDADLVRAVATRGVLVGDEASTTVSAEEAATAIGRS